MEIGLIFVRFDNGHIICDKRPTPGMMKPGTQGRFTGTGVPSERPYATGSLQRTNVKRQPMTLMQQSAKGSSQQKKSDISGISSRADITRYSPIEQYPLTMFYPITCDAFNINLASIVTHLQPASTVCSSVKLLINAWCFYLHIRLIACGDLGQFGEFQLRLYR